MTVINPSALPYITINATKELNLRTEQLETKIQQLEETEIRLNTMQRQLDDLQERLNALTGNETQTTENQAVAKREIATTNQPTLSQNYPNPVVDRTTIPFYIPNEVVNAQIIISNMLGQQIKQIAIDKRGQSEITMNLRVSPSAYGTYTYTLIADGEVIGAKNMVLGQ